jgi:hypothetical protein
MDDEDVGKESIALDRDKRHELKLERLRVGRARQTETIRNPLDVGVDRDALVPAIGVREHDVRRFSSDPWQRDELGQRARHPAAKALGDGLSAELQAASLRPEEAGGSDEGLEIRQVGGCHRAWSRVAIEDGWRHLVDAAVSALSGEYGGDEQLEWTAEVELAIGVGIGPREGAQQSPSDRPVRRAPGWGCERACHDEVSIQEDRRLAGLGEAGEERILGTVGLEVGELDPQARDRPCRREESMEEPH